MVSLETLIQEVRPSGPCQKDLTDAIAGSSGTLDENRVIRAIRWAELARLQSELLKGALEGRYLVALTGEPVFRRADPPAAAAKGSKSTKSCTFKGR